MYAYLVLHYLAFEKSPWNIEEGNVDDSNAFVESIYKDAECCFLPYMYSNRNLGEQLAGSPSISGILKTLLWDILSIQISNKNNWYI